MTISAYVLTHDPAHDPTVEEQAALEQALRTQGIELTDAFVGTLLVQGSYEQIKAVQTDHPGWHLASASWVSIAPRHRPQ